MRSQAWAGVALALVACGGDNGQGSNGSAGTAKGPSTVRIEPDTANLPPGASQHFVANVPVNWSLPEAAGTIDGDGNFVAPPAYGTFHVRATSRTDPAQSATATIFVSVSVTQLPSVAVSLSPATLSIGAGRQAQFTATVTGTSDSRVAWSATRGAIDASGTFTAPASIGAVQVTATSVADPSASATAYVTVTTARDSVTVTPASATVMAGMLAGAFGFHAVVQGPSDQTVTWSVQEGEAGGKVDANGYYFPPDTEGTYHVLATSKADPRLVGIATARVTYGNLVDSGGPIVPLIHVTAIWWGDEAKFPSDMRSGIEQVFGSLEGSPYLALANQYMRGASASVKFAGSLGDTSAPPASWPSTDQIAAEICQVLDAHGLSPAASDYYMVIPTGAGTGRPGGACGFHSSGSCHGKTVLLSYLPNPDGVYSCQWTGTVCDAASQATQSLASISVHELFEVMTDPLVSAWYNSDFQPYWEIGDKCAWTNKACVSLGGRNWELQSMWSNAAHACLQQ